MNTIVWILQVLLGLWNITGGLYMATHYQELINEWASATFPSFFWIAFGIIQVLFSIALILSLLKKFRKLAPVSALALAIIDLLGIAFYIAYTGSGLLWAIIPAVLLAFIAYWRVSKQ